MRVAPDISVLADHGSARIDTLQDGLDSIKRLRARSVDRDRCRPRKLQESMLAPLRTIVDIGTSHGVSGISVPNRCRGTVWNIIGLENTTLKYISMVGLTRIHHVTVKADDSPVRGGTPVHRTRKRLGWIGQLTATGTNADSCKYVAGADPGGREHRTHRVVIMQAGIHAAIGTDGAQDRAGMAWKQYRRESAAAIDNTLNAGC